MINQEKLFRALQAQLLAHLRKIPSPQELAIGGRQKWNIETSSEDYYYMDNLLVSVSASGKIRLHPKLPVTMPISSPSPKVDLPPSSMPTLPAQAPANHPTNV
jgi:hypothetical protein